MPLKQDVRMIFRVWLSNVNELVQMPLFHILVYPSNWAFHASLHYCFWDKQLLKTFSLDL